MSDGLELRMYRDVYAPGTALALPLKAAHRVVYVFSGAIKILGDKALSADDGLYAKSAMPVLAGPAGAIAWRYEIAAKDAEESLADGAQSDLLLSGPLTTIDFADASEGWLLRLDSVAFPAGGCAFRHTHRGPGIRCLVEGNIRIDAEGTSHSFGIGAPWFELGPHPVFAQAGDQPTRFVRVSLLPASLKGASSIRYVDPKDAARPKDQSYRGYIDQVIGRPSC